MEIEARKYGGDAVTVVSGRIDLRSAPELRDQAVAALVAGGGSLVLDLSDVEFIDSSGLGVLIGIQRESHRLEGRLQLVAPSGSAGQIFALTRTESFFTFVTAEAGGHATLAA